MGAQSAAESAAQLFADELGAPGPLWSESRAKRVESAHARVVATMQSRLSDWHRAPPDVARCLSQPQSASLLVTTANPN